MNSEFQTQLQQIQRTQKPQIFSKERPKLQKKSDKSEVKKKIQDHKTNTNLKIRTKKRLEIN